MPTWLLRQLLLERRLPEAWIPSTDVLEIRTLARLYLTLMAERRAWQQRVHAQLFHQGAPPIAGLLTAEGAAALAQADLSAGGRRAVDTATAAIDALTALLVPLRTHLEAVGRAQPAVRVLRRLYGIGLLSGTIIWAELGECHRFSSADQVVRFAGLEVSVWSSKTRRSAGHLARQGSPELGWALYEAAKWAAKPTSPDHAYYVELRSRLTAKQAALSVARKLARRCYHALRESQPVPTAGERSRSPAAA